MSVQFLFLSSLGLFSWIILCYLKKVEEYLMYSPENIDEHNAFQTLKMEQNDFSYLPTIPQYHVKEFYVNFICLLACICVLAKVAVVTEGYLARELYKQIKTLTNFEQNLQKPHADCILKRSKDALVQHVHKLERQNFELKLELRNKLDDSNDIWMKYLLMQRDPYNNCNTTCTKCDAFVPVVMSSQELKRLSH
ncbi:uncharacterized protein LOC101891441 [Musca domestica]|uniref:Uncharacterized protein LOC101891441 n=1 Tax=Musca domestica TaxID=7370 RepID=A0ABM3V2W2_MUSDO|nr:uncharacterized protein LOC101891441 [Musca domestica]